MGDFI